MEIKDIKFYIVEGEPARREARHGHGGTIEKVPPGLSGLFTHSAGFQEGKPVFDEATFHESPHRLEHIDEEEHPTYSSTIRLVTDGDLDAYTAFGSGFHADELEWSARQYQTAIAPLLLGVDALDREYVWQRLWYAQRFYYTGRGVVDQTDNMLWDLASRHACLPIHKLLGGCRDRVPAYRNIRGTSIDELVADAVGAKEEGFQGCKDHSYRGVKANSELARELRSAVGDDFWLMHDPVESYTYIDAVKIGRELERQGYMWMEEPLQDYDLMGLKKLCDTLDLPILALEWIGAIGGQPFNTSAYLALGAADIVRQRGVGITGQMKQAHLAESFGASVHGGTPDVVLAIDNDPMFEAMGVVPIPEEAELDCRGRLSVEDGWMQVVWRPERPAEPDWDEMERSAVSVV